VPGWAAQAVAIFFAACAGPITVADKSKDAKIAANASLVVVFI
jgi:hypothetical protein